MKAAPVNSVKTEKSVPQAQGEESCQQPEGAWSGSSLSQPLVRLQLWSAMDSSSGRPWSRGFSCAIPGQPVETMK